MPYHPLNAPPSTHTCAPLHPAAEHQRRRGLRRLWHATRYSCAGLRCAWQQAAFRLEVLLAAVLLPTALYLGTTWVERALLVASVLWVGVVELLNSAVEAVVDRVGLEWHALSKQAKDLGSAAVLVSVLLCMAVWGAAVWARWG